MDEGQRDTLKLVRQVLGKWCGNGIAQFPTIATFEYREELEFTANDVQPVLRYHQRTWKKVETGEFVPSQWETGFWRVLSASEIELVCAQASGRVEIARGPLRPTTTGFGLQLASVLVTNDTRMGKTKREFVLEKNTLRYTLEMSTTTVSKLTSHAHADLVRCDESGGAV